MSEDGVLSFIPAVLLSSVFVVVLFFMCFFMCLWFDMELSVVPVSALVSPLTPVAPGVERVPRSESLPMSVPVPSVPGVVVEPAESVP